MRTVCAGAAVRRASVRGVMYAARSLGGHQFVWLTLWSRVRPWLSATARSSAGLVRRSNLRKRRVLPRVTYLRALSWSSTRSGLRLRLLLWCRRGLLSMSLRSGELLCRTLCFPASRFPMTRKEPWPRWGSTDVSYVHVHVYVLCKALRM